MFRRLAIAVVLLGLTASTSLAACYEIYVINTGTNRVVRIPVPRIKFNPNGANFKMTMLREKKKLGPGEKIGYSFEGSFIIGDAWQGIYSRMVEPSPLPLSTPIDPNWQGPTSFGGGD